MAEYISAPVVTDPDELEAEVVAYLQEKIPGWEPVEGNLDYWIIKAVCARAAVIGESVTDVLASIFRYFGAYLLGLPPHAATPAVGAVTVTLIDDAGHTIPQGTVFGFAGIDGDAIGFRTTEPRIVPPGQTTAASIPVEAIEPGAAGNGLTGAGDVIDALDFVAAVALDAPTTGGQDEESDEDYLDRIRDELRLLAPRAITAEDFAVAARRVPEVERALALDLYDAVNDLEDQEGHVTVCVVGATGEPVSAPSKTAVRDLLMERRLLNLVVHVIDPVYTVIDVAFAITPWPDFDPEGVRAAAEQAVRDYLSPATWGQPNYGDQPRWLIERRVRYLEVAQVIQEVRGVRYVDSLSLNGGADGQDVILDGIAPLPRPGEVVGAVTGALAEV